jgi:hypothetical protein
MDVQTTAFSTGIVFGSVAIGSASYVWLRHRIFGFGGSMLSLVGIALLGLSIWSGIRIEISQAGLQADFQRLAQQVDTVVEANQVVTQEVKKVADIAQTGRQQFVELTKTLEAERAITPSKLEEIRRSVLAAPVVDTQRLERATESLRAVKPSSGRQPQ